MSTRALLLLAFSYLLILALVAFGVPLGLSLADRTDGEIRAQARSEADIVAVSAAALLRPADAAALRRLVTAAGRPVRGRVVIVDRGGRVIADSATDRSLGVLYRTPERPEIGAALGGRRLQERRRSRTLGQELLVTAAPVRDARGRLRGAVRITQSVSAVTRAVRRNVLGLTAVGGAVLLLGFGAATLLARRLSAPLRDLEGAADRVAAGDLETVAPVRGAREHQALAVAFNTMTGRVSRNLEAQQEFVADASHQLRTPLTGLRLRLEEAEAESTSAAARAHLTAATGELDRLSHTIDELLVLSRGGERDAPGERVRLADAAQRAADRWAGAAAEHGHRLAVRGAEVPAAVWCAPVDLDRALDGVVENAIRYTPAGGRLEIRVTADGIEVLDDGPGIPADELALVVERFHRGRGGRAAGPGTGLGLTIARELLRRWDGDLRLTPRPGGGLQVQLLLPRQPATSPVGT
jgi:signal transduction histidine kinase